MANRGFGIGELGGGLTGDEQMQERKRSCPKPMGEFKGNPGSEAVTKKSDRSVAKRFEGIRKLVDDLTDAGWMRFEQPSFPPR